MMKRFRLEKEREKNLRLEKNLEKFKQDMNSLLKNLSLVFALALYVDRIRDLPIIESVHIIEKEDLVDVWTIIQESNLDLEEKIAEAQCELMRIHKELDFDFMVFPRFGQEIENILPQNSRKIYPKG